MSSHEPTEEVPQLNLQINLASALVAVEGLILVVLAVLDLVSLESDRLSLGISTAVFLGAYATLLLACAWSLRTRQGWTRGPILITQLISLGLAWNIRDQPQWAIPLAVMALVVLVCVLMWVSAEGRAAEERAAQHDR